MTRFMYPAEFWWRHRWGWPKEKETEMADRKETTSRWDGGPAFPGPGTEGSYAGMSLRDYFAGIALARIPSGMGSLEASKYAFQVADAVLDERDEYGIPDEDIR